MSGESQVVGVDLKYNVSKETRELWALLYFGERSFSQIGRSQKMC
jgi:hypothetical protein